MVRMDGRRKTVLALALLFAFGVAGYRVWTPSAGKLATRASAPEPVSQIEGEGPSPLAELDQVQSRLPAGDSVRRDLDQADAREIRGRVVDSKGEGISGLTVISSVVNEELDHIGVPTGRRNKCWAGRAATDESGHFVIAEVPVETVLLLCVEKNGAELARQELQLPFDQPVVVTIDKISLGRITGRIVDSSATIIGQAKMMILSLPRSGRSATVHGTVRSGKFDIGDLPAGSYMVVLEAEAFVGLATRVEVKSDETVDMGHLVMTLKP